MARSRGVAPNGQCRPADRRLAPCPIASRSRTVIMLPGTRAATSRAVITPTIPPPMIAKSAISCLHVLRGRRLCRPLNEGAQWVLGLRAANAIEDSLTAPRKQRQIWICEAALLACCVLNEYIVSGRAVPLYREIAVEFVFAVLVLESVGNRRKEFGAGAVVAGRPDDDVELLPLHDVRVVQMAQREVPAARRRIGHDVHHRPVRVERDEVVGVADEATEVDRLVDAAQRRLRDAVAREQVPSVELPPSLEWQRREVVAVAGHVVVIGERRVVQWQEVRPARDPGDTPWQLVVVSSHEIEERFGTGLAAADH